MNLIVLLLVTREGKGEGWEGKGEGRERKGEGWEDDRRQQQADEIGRENCAKPIAEFEQA